ncbi:MAG: hypothetical protein WA051_01480 [Minisyncoccia bacterium]
MKEELISKLRVALTEPIEKESQVVYILTEVRKLLDRTLGEKKLEKYPVLNFYCNWALHIEIGGTAAIDPILDRIEQLLADPDLSNPRNIPEVMYSFLNLDLLSTEIGNLLSEHGIENPLVKHVYRSKFRDLLVGILRDCPLKPKNRKLTEFCFKDSDENNVTYLIQFKNTFTMPSFDETHSTIVGTFLFQ